MRKIISFNTGKTLEAELNKAMVTGDASALPRNLKAVENAVARDRASKRLSQDAMLNLMLLSIEEPSFLPRIQIRIGTVIIVMNSNMNKEVGTVLIIKYS